MRDEMTGEVVEQKEFSFGYRVISGRTVVVNSLMSAAKDQIRQIIIENNINSVADIYTLLRRQLQRHSSGIYGSRTGCNSGLPEKAEGGFADN